DYLVPRRRDVWSGTQGVFELAIAQRQTAPIVRASKVREHLGKGTRCRILERKDRLLLVADGKDRAVCTPRTRACEEFACDAADNLPLLRAGILRLIDQDVIDALVELVVHPGCSAFSKKRQGFVDQVLIIEQPAAILC